MAARRGSDDDLKCLRFGGIVKKLEGSAVWDYQGPRSRVRRRYSVGRHLTLEELVDLVWIARCTEGSIREIDLVAFAIRCC